MLLKHKGFQKSQKGIVILLMLIVFASCSSTRGIMNNEKESQNFTKKQTLKIESKSNTTPMRVFKIDSAKDLKLLTSISKDVKVNAKDTVLKYFTERLYSTVMDSASLGVGIAAPQVGILKQIIWVQRFDKPGEPFELYINPKIIQYSKKKQTYREGCLSVPDRMDVLETRSYAILIEYDTIDNMHHLEMVEDFTAVIFQHEIDHLKGIIYIDRIRE